MKHEAKAQTKFNHWLKEVYKQTAAFELKYTETSLPFSNLAPHQRDALIACHHQTLVYKIPDAGFQNPFDCVSLSRIPAYVVVRFPKSFEVISIDVWVKESEESKRRSLTYERAKQISTYSIDI